MAVIQNKKVNLALDSLLSRQDYLVTQANDLAKAFGRGCDISLQKTVVNGL